MKRIGQSSGEQYRRICRNLTSVALVNRTTSTAGVCDRELVSNCKHGKLTRC